MGSEGLDSMVMWGCIPVPILMRQPMCRAMPKTALTSPISLGKNMSGLLWEGWESNNSQDRRVVKPHPSIYELDIIYRDWW